MEYTKSCGKGVLDFSLDQGLLIVTSRIVFAIIKSRAFHCRSVSAHALAPTKVLLPFAYRVICQEIKFLMVVRTVQHHSYEAVGDIFFTSNQSDYITCSYSVFCG